MKKLFYTGLMLVAATVFVATGCKKESAINDDDTAAQATTATDESDVTNESNKAMDDANQSLNAAAFSSGRYSSAERLLPSLCGASIDTFPTEKKIIITYDGTTCSKDGKKRTGSITLQLVGDKWKNAGSTVTVTFNDYAVTKPNGKTFKLNGSHTITNVSGGLVWQGTTPVVHNASGTLKLSFENGTTREWTVTRKITYTLDNTKHKVKVESSGTDNKVIVGTTRKGDPFTVTITTPLEANDVCGWNRPVAGVRTVTSGAFKSITATLGVDASGNAVAAGDCADYFKISWTNAKGSQSSIIKY